MHGNSRPSSHRLVHNCCFDHKTRAKTLATVRGPISKWLERSVLAMRVPVWIRGRPERTEVPEQAPRSFIRQEVLNHHLVHCPLNDPSVCPADSHRIVLPLPQQLAQDAPQRLERTGLPLLQQLAPGAPQRQVRRRLTKCES